MVLRVLSLFLLVTLLSSPADCQSREDAAPLMATFSIIAYDAAKQ
jgi:hypothetical protein